MRTGILSLVVRHLDSRCSVEIPSTDPCSQQHDQPARNYKTFSHRFIRIFIQRRVSLVAIDPVKSLRYESCYEAT